VPRQSSRQFWAGLPDILRQDRDFRHYLIARLLMVVGGMGTGFVAVGAIARWHVADSTMGLYTGAMLVGEVFGSLPIGLLADRFGHKLSLELAALAASLAFGVAWLAPSVLWYYLVFLLLGIGSGALRVSGMMVVMEFCDAGRRPTYIGLANTGVGVVEMAAPLLGAWLASIDYGWLFALSAALSLASLVIMRWWVQEPRRVAGLRREIHNGG